MKGFKCDRCGTFVADDDVYASEAVTVSYSWTEGDDGAWIKTSTNDYDLCNDCRSALVDWIEVFQVDADGGAEE